MPFGCFSKECDHNQRKDLEEKKMNKKILVFVVMALMLSTAVLAVPIRNKFMKKGVLEQEPAQIKDGDDYWCDALFGAFKAVYGTTNPIGDFNDDGKANLVDFAILAQYYGQDDQAWCEAQFN